MQKRNFHHNHLRTILSLFLFICIASGGGVFVYAQETASEDVQRSAQEEGIGESAEPEQILSEEERALLDLRKEVERKNKEIKKLEEEAEEYRSAVRREQAKGSTFQAEITRVDRDLKRLRSEVAVAERKIQRLELEIQITSTEIETKERSIRALKNNLATLLQAVAEQSRESFLIIFLKHNALSEFFQEVDSYASLQEKILRSLKTLYALRDELSIKKARAEEQRNELQNLQQGLEGRKTTQENVKKEKNDLLSITKNNEARYQELLRDREEKRRALELEILEIETQIQVIIDPASLPEKRAGFFGKPLPDVSLLSCWKAGGTKEENCITQYFGNTPFAQSGHYNGKAHNGLDFRADVGTPVLAAKEGIVRAIGDTDRACRGASYGKWVLIEHPNNISTLYAHLSTIQVKEGKSVGREAQIGFSGNTGYATGPHLHFTVFATQAVQIKTIRSRVCGTLMTLPVAALNGYLNPLDYL